MKKPDGYDEAEAYTGEYDGPGPLPAGLYICRIMQAVEEMKNGKRFLTIGFDIVEGDYAGYYKAAYNMDTKADKKWRGKYSQYMDGKGTPYLKGMITSIERSNPGFAFKWGENAENTLKGKKFGAVMRREEYEQGKFTTKIHRICSVEGLKKAKVPEDKLWDNTASFPEMEMPPAGPMPTDADFPANW